MSKHRSISEELGIDPAQGVDELLAQAGELIVAGRLVVAPKHRVPAEPAAEPAAETAPTERGE